MTKIQLVFLLATAFLLSACGLSSQLNDEAATQAPTTAVVTQLPTTTEVPAATVESDTTEMPAATVQQTGDLDTFIMQLETAVTRQDYAQMQALMSDPIVVGAWRSEWRLYAPDQMIAEFQSAALSAPTAVQFTGLTDDEIAQLIGQPPATMFGPETNMVAALHSTGWGEAAGDDAILFVVEADGVYTWSAFLYNNGRFAAADMETVILPLGLIYQVIDEGIYQIQSDGQSIQLLDAQTASIPNLQIAPDGRHAAYLDDERQLWLLDIATNEQQQLAGDFDLSYFLMWGDNDTLFVGVWLDPNEADGPNNGHMATLDINSGILQILDEQNLSGNRPSLLSDTGAVAFDVFTAGRNGLVYIPDSGLQTFDATAFTADNEMIVGNLFNPAWSLSGEKIAWLSSSGERIALQIFDLGTETAVQLFDWDPARFGGLVPSPVWSSDGQWLALNVLANGPEGSGIWLLTVDGSTQTLVEAAGHNPLWTNEMQLIFNLDGEGRLYDVGSGQQFRLDLPPNSLLIHVTALQDLATPPLVAPTASDEVVGDTAVQYVQAQQNVTMYSGPGETFEEIGGVFDGQTALVTGQSPDGSWWRVICPDDTIGDCWVTADPAFTLPVD